MTTTLGNTIGVYLITVILSSCFLGITILQAWNYFMSYSDTVYTKLTVVAVVVLDVAHVALSSHNIYHFTILNYANPAALMKSSWSGGVSIGASTTLTLIVQLFYARRCHMVSGGNKWFPALIVLLALAHCACGWGVVVRSIQLEDFLLFLQIIPLERAFLITAMVTDALITGWLCYYFQTSRTGFKSTQNLLNRLTVYTVNNGILTTVTDILVLGLSTQVDNWIYFALYNFIANFYSISLLATLNSRPAQGTPVVLSHGSRNQWSVETGPADVHHPDGVHVQMVRVSHPDVHADGKYPHAV